MLVILADHPRSAVSLAARVRQPATRRPNRDLHSLITHRCRSRNRARAYARGRKPLAGLVRAVRYPDGSDLQTEMPAALEADPKDCHILRSCWIWRAGLIAKGILVSQICKGEAGHKRQMAEDRREQRIRCPPRVKEGVCEH